MANILENIINREGGFVNDPKDHGGATKYGITIHTLSDYYGRDATVDEVRNLSKATALDIYERKYYTGPRINLLPDSIKEQVLDIGVMSGPKRAIKMVQTIVNEAGFGPISVDGVLGPITRQKVTEADQKMGKFMVNALVEERIAFYEGIVARHSDQSRFIKGWKRRANTFRI